MCVALRNSILAYSSSITLLYRCTFCLHILPKLSWSVCIFLDVFGEEGGSTSSRGWIVAISRVKLYFNGPSQHTITNAWSIEASHAMIESLCHFICALMDTDTVQVVPDLHAPNQIQK